MMAHDLLTDPMLAWRDTQRRLAYTTLPGQLALLASSELVDFPRVRTHQLDPWCMFLTQLAAIALHRAGRSDPELSEVQWRDLLLALTKGDHAPWSLVVTDVSKPAFFQPPVPEGRIDRWTVCQSPDDIDMLATAKAHDVKPGLIAGTNVEKWIYAIVTLQTMQGFYGAGKYGIARMKGGYACRPRVGYAADQTLSTRFRRDVHALLSSWPDLIKHYQFREEGLSLIWTAPWDGTVSLSSGELAPHFIEICRRIRCVGGPSGVHCAYTTSRTRRCLAETVDGDVGDPWIPVRRSGGALNVGRLGFGYQLVAALLSQDEFAPAAAQQLHPGDPDPVLFLASALARGEGGTEGLHSRALALTGPVRQLLGRPDGRALLGKRAETQVADAAMMRRSVLSRALKQIAIGTSPMRSEFDARVDDIFFDHLFSTMALSDDDARLAFDKRLAQLAWGELQRVIRASPGADARRFKAISDAEWVFTTRLRKHFPDTAERGDSSDGVSA
jgi:CRISPR system Cascade subunit CasA